MLARDIEMFIEHCGLKGLSTKTINSYEQTLRLFMQYMDEQGILLTEKITHLAIQGYIKSIHPKAITRERRKLKAYKRLLDKGIVTIEEIDGYFRSWLSGNYKYMSRDQIYKMNSLYVKLFGRSVTWKKGHGRLRWLMAHPSAA